MICVGTLHPAMRVGEVTALWVVGVRPRPPSMEQTFLVSTIQDEVDT